MDIIIRNGTIVDGTGKPGFAGDIGIEGDKIAAIGDLKNAGAAQVIDAKGLVVAPGFVDILNHADAYLTIFLAPSTESLLRQGVTTVLGGNCGASLAPLVHGNLIAVVQKWANVQEINVNWERFSEYLGALAALKIGVNFGSLVGHATVRRGLLGDETRPMTDSELRSARKLVEDALAEGAFGLSFAPAYSHAHAANREEIDSVVAPAARVQRLLAVHLRNEGPDIVLALKEAIAIAQRHSCSLELSHFKVIGKKFWDLAPAALAMIDENVAKGTDIHFDFYPYRTSAMVAYLLLPPWAASGGRKQMLERLRNKEVRKKIVQEMQDNGQWDWEGVRIAQARERTFVGKTIQEVARDHGSTEQEALAELLLASEGRLLVFIKTSSPENILAFGRYPRSFFASAGGGYNLEWSKRGELVHPRSFGAFPRAIRKFVNRTKTLDLPEAIHKMTLGPAEKIGFKNRGKVAKGYFADLVAFDPEKIADRARLAHPYRFASGIHYVIVNGKIAVNEDGFTGVRVGAILRAA